MRSWIDALHRFGTLAVLAGWIGVIAPGPFPLHRDATANHAAASAVVSAPAAGAPAASGGRVEQCALSIGVLIGAGLSFWSNPILSMRFLELGAMMVAIYC